MIRIACLIAALAIASPARGERPVALELEGCAGTVDAGQVANILKLELETDGSFAGIILTDRAALHPEAIGVRVECHADRMHATLGWVSGTFEELFFTEATVEARSRLLSLVLAERLRHPPAPPPPPVAPPPAVALTVPPPAPRNELSPAAIHPVGKFRDNERMRQSGIAALTLASIAVAGFAAGSPIAAIGDDNVKRSDLRGAGGAVLGASCAPLIGGAIAFGYWMHERQLPPTGN